MPVLYGKKVDEAGRQVGTAVTKLILTLLYGWRKWWRHGHMYEKSSSVT